MSGGVAVSLSTQPPLVAALFQLLPCHQHAEPHYPLLVV
jgi:hypothetical protein